MRRRSELRLGLHRPTLAPSAGSLFERASTPKRHLLLINGWRQTEASLDSFGNGAQCGAHTRRESGNEAHQLSLEARRVSMGLQISVKATRQRVGQPRRYRVSDQLLSFANASAEDEVV